MGEEEKKKAEEQKPEEEKKKPEEPPKDDKTEEKKADESKEAAPTPPPSDIVLRVFMHCEGCARKVRKSLNGFPGVEEVETDCKTQKVVVKGEKADPLKVLERIQKKSHRQVELLSPIPKPPAEEPKKPPEEKEVVKPQEKKEEPQVITVVLKVHMHCEACAQEIKRRIQRMKGVQNAEPDLKSSQVTVKGVFEASQLVDYVSKRTGKKAVIVKVEPEKKEEEKPKEGKVEEKKPDEGGEKEAKKPEAGDGDKEKAAAPADGGAGGGADQEAAAPAKEEVVVVQEDGKVVEVKKNEFYYYHPQNNQVVYNPQRFANEMYAYPPQIFSDENPNACSVM